MNIYIVTLSATNQVDTEILGVFNDEYSARNRQDYEVIKYLKQGAKHGKILDNKNIVDLDCGDYSMTIQVTTTTFYPKGENSKDRASIFEEVVNNCGFNGKDIAHEMSKMHRYLQNEFGKFCLYYLAEMAKHYDNDTYDGRNGYICEVSAEIAEQNEVFKYYLESVKNENR